MTKVWNCVRIAASAIHATLQKKGVLA